MRLPHPWRLAIAGTFMVAWLAAFCLAGEPAAQPTAAGPTNTASSSAGPAAFPWPIFGGYHEELAAEELELRDEIISAHLGFLGALEAALADIERTPTDDPHLALRWARVEYLLETSFRLLESTGEYEAFLKAAAKFASLPRLIPEPLSVEAPLSEPESLDGGLIFEHDEGRLLPELADGRMVLVPEPGATPVALSNAVTARPINEEEPDRGAYVDLIRSRAAWLSAVALERLGRTREAGEKVAGLGQINDWLVLGPLDHDQTTYSEIALDMDEYYNIYLHDREFTGKSGKIHWRPHHSIDPLGKLFLQSLFRGEGQESAFALALVHSERNREATLRLGTNSSATVSVNHLQTDRRNYTEFADPDQEAFNVWLRKGWNLVFVKTASTGADDWTLALRFTDPSGQPLALPTARVNSDSVGAILAAAGRVIRDTELDRFFIPARPPNMGGISILSGKLLDHPNDGRANFYLASFLTARRMMEGPDRFDRELIFRRALDLSDNNPFFTLQAARAVEAGVEGPEREENLRLVLLRSAADHGSAAALSDIGRLYLDVMRQPRRADAYAEEALTVNPLSLRAGILDYDTAIAMRWFPAARQLLLKLVNQHPTSAAARLRQGRSDLKDGKYRKALSEFHAVLEVDAANREALDGAVMAMGMLGQTSTAVELLQKHIVSFPYDSWARLKLAALYRNLGRDPEALVVLDEALQLAPEDMEAIAMRLDIARETYAEGKDDAAPAPLSLMGRRQELDMTPPRRPVPGGWEYLYFQVEDRMEKNGSIDRIVSFALRIYTPSAAFLIRHLGFPLEAGLEKGTVASLSLVRPNGEREVLSPVSLASEEDGLLKFNLPPLREGMAVEAEVRFCRTRAPFLFDYFGQIAPLTQSAPARLSRYMFTYPKGAKMFFRPANGAPEAMVVESGDGATVTRIWEMTDLPAFLPEPSSPGQHELMPSVQVSSFENWDDFARWYWWLFGGQYHTPPELTELARTIAGDEEVPLAKLDRAAEWVSRNLGHRGWEFGMYAFRPINARTILSRLSADGKDRTLLLCLLAREYGLQAWPVLARLRDRRFSAIGSEDLSLPLLEHFNHSLVMIKTKLGGDVFLDASNPYRPPGVMPSQLFGSPGMAIIPEAAERIIIPDGGVNACRWEESAEMVVDEDGSVLWEEHIEGTGAAAENLRMRFRNEETRNVVWTSFLASLGATPSAAAASFVEDASSPASASFSGRARLRRLASVSEDKVVATVPPLPGAISRATGRPVYPLSLFEFVNVGAREQDLVLPYGFRIVRKLRIAYPREWQLRNQPSSGVVETPFGWLEVVAEASSGTLAVDFSMDVPGHRIAAADFADFRFMAAAAARWLAPVLVWEK